MEKFKEWYDTNLIVDRYPSFQTFNLGGRHENVDIIINVSDEYRPEYELRIENRRNRLYYWFPMNECAYEMGIHSIFGALTVLHYAYRFNNKVLIHCHAGVNRSQTVRDCFHFLMTGVHIHQNTTQSNMLLWNIKTGNLPEWTEKWLAAVKIALNNPKNTGAGILDWSIIKAKEGTK